LYLFVDLTQFRKEFDKAKHIAIITGAGVSAESGVPTIRGAEGHWRTWKTQVTLSHTHTHTHTHRQSVRVSRLYTI